MQSSVYASDEASPVRSVARAFVQRLADGPENEVRTETWTRDRDDRRFRRIEVRDPFA
jgi:hypothetical protein